MSGSADVAAGARAYAAFFETLTPERLGELDELCAPEVRFRDPFNDVAGVPALRAVLAKMFEDVAAPRFEVEDIAVSGNRAYLRWRFTCIAKRDAHSMTIDGISELLFDEWGRVTAHVDHWDSGSQFYERLPLLGTLIKFVKRRVAVPPH